MKKKNISIVISLVMLFALALTGCGNKGPAVTTPPVTTAPVATDTPNVTGSPDVTGTPDAQEDSLVGVGDMLGKTDDEVKDLYGGGEENKSEDGTAILGRAYEAELDGKAVTIETVYSEEQTVDAASVVYSDATADEIEAILTETYGDAEVVGEQDSANEEYLRWEKDGVYISLYTSYDITAVEFSSAE